MTVTIESAYLRKVFEELGTLFKNSEQFRAFNFTVRDKTLYIAANTGIQYETRIPVDAAGEASVSVLFQDVSEILGQRGTVRLDIEPVYVLLHTGLFDITFSAASDSVTPMFYKYQVGESALSDGIFFSAYKTLTNTAILRKAYKLDPYLCYVDRAAYVKFPTMWIRTYGCGISLSLDRITAAAINTFAPSSYTIRDDVVFFYNNHAVLCIPYKAPQDDNFTSLTPKSGYKAKYDLEPVATALKKVIKVVGEGTCMILLGENGFVLRILRKGINTSMSFGDTSTLSNNIISLPLEIFYNAVLLTNSSANITYGGGLLWIATQYNEILLSVTS